MTFDLTAELPAYQPGGGAAAALQARLLAHGQALIASRGGGDREEVARLEARISADPEAIRFDDQGLAWIDGERRPYAAGRFSTPSLDELRRLAAPKVRGRRSLRLFVVDGASPVTDIGALQANAAPGALFQVASQFNCLESPGAFITPVASYFHDPTQGPRASISAFPGTLVRHYAAPRRDGSRFVQRRDGRQIELLAGVATAELATVRSGYLRAGDVIAPEGFARALEERFGHLRVGLHDEVEVPLGYDWDGAVEGRPRIAQVFTSTIAGGMYGGLGDGDATTTICRRLLRGAYLGTLLAAAALGKRCAVLTLVGGGVFGNPVPLIWEAIQWALAEVAPLLHEELAVIVNGRNLGREVAAAELLGAVRERSGALLRFDGDGVTVES